MNLCCSYTPPSVYVSMKYLVSFPSLVLLAHYVYSHAKRIRKLARFTQCAMLDGCQRWHMGELMGSHISIG